MWLLHKDGKRYKIQSNEILRSWNFPLTVETTEVACSKYPKAYGKLGFRDGSLLYNIKDAKLYLVSDSVLRHIVSPSALERLGVTMDDAMVVSDKDINIMKRGEEIN